MLAILAKIGTWLLKNPTIVATAFVTIAFIMVHVADNARINTLNDQIDNPKTGYKKRVESAIADNTTLRNNNGVLSETLAHQNAAFEELKSKADAASGKFDTIIAGMAASNASTARKLDIINKAQPGPNRCDSALALIKGSVQ